MKRDKHLLLYLAFIFMAELLLLASRFLETTLVGHMLVQIPLLVVAGIWAARFIPERWRPLCNRFNNRGVPGITVAAFAFIFWMIPRSLDAAVTEPAVNVVKYLSLPLLAGVPLALSWRLLGFVGRSFIVLNAAAMFFAVGYLYATAPVRLCSAYLLDQQQQAGYILIGFACLLVASWYLIPLRGGNK